MITAIFPTTPKTKPYLDLATSSLQNNSVNDYKIIVAENGAGTDYPQGQCTAVNRVLDKVDTEWTAVFNDDFYFPFNWDHQITFKFDVECPNWIEPMSVGSAPPFLKLDISDNIEAFNFNLVENFFEDNEDFRIENGFNLGFFIKTDLFKKIGGYDEAYDPWGSNSDSDLQYKLEIAGIQPKRNRGSLLYHFGSKSGTFDTERQSYWQKNWDYFVEKWGFYREESPDIWNHNLHIPLDKLKYRPSWSIYD